MTNLSMSPKTVTTEQRGAEPLLNVVLLHGNLPEDISTI